MVLATFLAGFLSLLISLPTNWDIYTEGKRIGATIENRLPGYEVCSPAVFKASEILTSLFPYTWDPEVPEIEYGDSPLVWNYYSYNRDASDSGINYVVQGTKDPPPDGMILIDTKDDIALYMASEELWQEHRSTQPSARIDHPLYSIDRGIMFRSVPMVDGPRVINVIEVLRKIGIDVDSLLKRLGVKT